MSHSDEHRLDIFELARSRVNQLRHVRRFTGCHLNHGENVSEHSWFVSFYALLLTLDINERRAKLGREEMEPWVRLDLEAVLGMAVVHDLEEAITGDFPRPFKYSSKDLKNQLDVAAKNGYKQLINGIGVHQAHVKQDLQLFWDMQKNESDEATIVKFCDLLAFLVFAYEEVLSGNSLILRYCTEVQPYIRSFSEKGKEVVHPYIDGLWGLWDSINQTNRKMS